MRSPRVVRFGAKSEVYLVIFGCKRRRRYPRPDIWLSIQLHSVNVNSVPVRSVIERSHIFSADSQVLEYGRTDCKATYSWNLRVEAKCDPDINARCRAEVIVARKTFRSVGKGLAPNPIDNFLSLPWVPEPKISVWGAVVRFVHNRKGGCSPIRSQF